MRAQEEQARLHASLRRSEMMAAMGSLVGGFYRAPGDRIVGVLLHVDVGEPAVIAVVAPETPLALPSGMPSAS